MYQDRENKMRSAGDVKGHETSAGEMAFHISGSVMRKAPAQGRWGQGQKEVEQRSHFYDSWYLVVQS